MCLAASISFIIFPPGSNLSLRSLIRLSPCTKHGKSLCDKNIISTSLMILSACSYSAIYPSRINSLYSLYFLDLMPPSTSTCSEVSLKCAPFSRWMPLPGALESRKPKSMCMMWPSMSTRMLPLCLSFICIRKHTNE